MNLHSRARTQSKPLTEAPVTTIPRARFENGVLARIAQGMESGVFGAAVALDQLQERWGLPDSARLFGSNQRVQAAMAMQAQGTAPEALLDLWGGVEGDEMPPELRERMLAHERLHEGMDEQAGADSERTGSEGAEPAAESSEIDPLVEEILAVGGPEAEQVPEALECMPDEALIEEPKGTSKRSGELQFGWVAMDMCAPQTALPSGGEPTREVEGLARIFATSQVPILSDGQSCVAEEEIYELQSFEDELCELPDEASEWQPVEKIWGSAENPLAYSDIVPDSLFIDGAPSPLDIAQGNIGTCWLLAGLGSVVSQGPSTIIEAMSIRDGVVTVRLFRPEGDDWVPVELQMPATLPRDADGYLYGTPAQLAEQPKWSELYATIFDGELFVQENLYFEAALWVPMMEKAFALYADRYGLPSDREESGYAQRTGYDQIDRGFMRDSALVLLGPSAKTDSIAFGAGLPGAPLKLLYALVRLSERTPDGDMEIVTLNCSARNALQNLSVVIGQTLPELEDRVELHKSLLALAIDIDAWGVTGAQKGIEALCWRASHAQNDLAGQISSSPNAERLYQNLDMVGDIGDEGEHGLVTSHLYAVLSAQLRDDQGQILDFPMGERQQQIARIDPVQSELTLFNPWGEHEPSFQQGSYDNDGRFVLTLEQALRLFGCAEMARISAE